MPSFTTPIHEYNQCHGPEDGKFCSDPAPAGGAKAIPAGEQGECFRNASQFVRAHEDFALVHGKVTNGEGKTFDHAWTESKTEVADPTTGVQMAKDRWYRLVKAQPEAKYTAEHAAINMLRTRNHGPWTAEEVGKRQLREYNDCHAPDDGKFCSSFKAPARGTAVASHEPDGRIALRPGFFELSPEVQHWVLGHEVAHGFTTPLMADPNLIWSFLDDGVLGKKDEARGRWEGYGGNASVDEAITDAVTDFFLAPAELKQRAPAVYQLVDRLATQHGWSKARFDQLHARAKKGADPEPVPVDPFKDLAFLKLSNKVLRAVPGSPKQKQLRDKVRQRARELGAHWWADTY
jgi:hypothetical protein